MRNIQLTKGVVALIDNADFKLVSKHKWYLGSHGYAVTTVAAGKKVLMHRLLMNPPAKQCVDHINGEKLDNRRPNLRNCTPSQISRNGVGWGKSGYKGVYLMKTPYKLRKPWQAHISFDGRKYHLGFLAKDKEAAAAYNEAATKHYSQFARLNTL